MEIENKHGERVENVIQSQLSEYGKPFKKDSDKNIAGQQNTLISHKRQCEIIKDYFKPWFQANQVNILPKHREKPDDQKDTKIDQLKNKNLSISEVELQFY